LLFHGILIEVKLSVYFMLLQLQHIAQPDDYTCGPASIAMVLQYMGQPVAYERITELCRAHPERGTENDHMVEAIEALGLVPTCITEGGIADLRNALNQDQPIIINYLNPRSGRGHFAVVIGLDDEHVILADPKNGHGFRLTQADLQSRWHNNDKTIFGWMMTVGRPSNL
jgi:predicted double-glycine peptidase